jgi:hypothetical protein
MHFRLSISLIALLLSLACHGQGIHSWGKWHDLTGEWKGEGSGIPGDGYINSNIYFELDSTVLFCREHYDYGILGDFKRRTVRDEILIIYLNSAGNPDMAITFNNKGNTVKYSVSYQNNIIVLKGSGEKPFPVFRKTFYILDDGSLKLRYDISHDGINYITYTEGIMFRVNNQ